MNHLRKLLALGFVICSLQVAICQKFGHIDSQQLLLDLPQIKKADEQLTAYQNTLITKGEQMVKKLETDYNAYVLEANEGKLSKVQMQQKEGALTQQQQAIQNYEQEVQQKLLTKREELYKPILDNVKQVVDKLGKEQGYTMIFDSGSGFLLHTQSSEDLMSKVKAALGI
jgi:outer membrane protein